MNLACFDKNLLDKTMCLLFFQNKMQREIGDKIQLGDTLNPLNDVSAVPAIDNTSNVKDVFGKIGKLGDLWDRGKADASLIRYLPGGSEVLRQGKIFNIVPKKAYVSSTYTDKKHLNLQLSQQQIRIEHDDACCTNIL